MTTVVLVCCGVAAWLGASVGVIKICNTCGSLDDNVAKLHAEETMRAAVRHEMLDGDLPCDDGSTLAGVKRELTCVNGYDVAGVLADRRRVPADQRDVAWYAKRGVAADRIMDFENPEVSGPAVRIGHVLPRFVAACTLELRSKFGSLAPTDANKLLVEKTYLKLCKQHGVRQHDIAHHRQAVLTCFFTDTGEDAFVAARFTAPKWLLWLWGGSLRTTTGPQVA